MTHLILLQMQMMCVFGKPSLPGFVREFCFNWDLNLLLHTPTLLL